MTLRIGEKSNQFKMNFYSKTALFPANFKYL